MKIIFTIFVALNILFANSLSDAKFKKMAIKGSKIAKVFCDSSKLPSAKGDIDKTIESISRSGACANLDKRKLLYIAYYLSSKSKIKKRVDVPSGAKCPVCGMFVYKYPKWAALMVIDGKKHYFDGVKDMMKYYFFDGDFKYDRAKISKMKVTNYYTLETIDAKDALYVYDSKKYGPMGRELIPFSNKKELDSFIADYGGKLMLFKDITPKNVMALDGVELK